MGGDLSMITELVQDMMTESAEEIVVGNLQINRLIIKDIRAKVIVLRDITMTNTHSVTVPGQALIQNVNKKSTQTKVMSALRKTFAQMARGKNIMEMLEMAKRGTIEQNFKQLVSLRSKVFAKCQLTSSAQNLTVISNIGAGRQVTISDITMETNTDSVMNCTIGAVKSTQNAMISIQLKEEPFDLVTITEDDKKSFEFLMWSCALAPVLLVLVQAPFLLIVNIPLLTLIMGAVFQGLYTAKKATGWISKMNTQPMNETCPNAVPVFKSLYLDVDDAKKNALANDCTFIEIRMLSQVSGERPKKLPANEVFYYRTKCANAEAHFLNLDPFGGRRIDTSIPATPQKGDIYLGPHGTNAMVLMSFNGIWEKVVDKDVDFFGILNGKIKYEGYTVPEGELIGTQEVLLTTNIYLSATRPETAPAGKGIIVFHGDMLEADIITFIVFDDSVKTGEVDEDEVELTMYKDAFSVKLDAMQRYNPKSELLFNAVLTRVENNPVFLKQSALYLFIIGGINLALGLAYYLSNQFF